MGGGIWSPLNTEPWCTVFCRLFDMAPHLGTFLILMKVSEKIKKMCLPWPRRWAGPCYRMPRYYIHETFRLFLVLLFFYQIWFQLWFAVSLVLTIGYGYPEHRIKRNVNGRDTPQWIEKGYPGHDAGVGCNVLRGLLVRIIRTQTRRVPRGGAANGRSR